MADILGNAIGKAVTSLLTGGANEPPDPNWDEVKEFDFGDKEYKPSEGESKAALDLINKAKLGEDARKVFGQWHRDYQKSSLEEAQTSFNGQKEQWATEAKEKLGDKLEASVTAANKVLETHGSKELVGLLQQFGLSNRVEVIQFLSAVAEKLPANAAPAGGDNKGTGGDSKTPAHVRLFASNG